MKGERVVPKPPDDVCLTMTADEADRLAKQLVQTYAALSYGATARWGPGVLSYDVCAAINEALS